MTTTFVELGVSADLADTLTKMGIETPFPIQQHTIEEALTGRDVCAKAPTGSGKTLAFGIPIVERIKRARPKCPRALILVPTRELAVQVGSVMAEVAKPKGLRVAVVYGGAGYGDQAKQIRHGCDIVVACPGRLKDLIERGALMLKDVEICVLDEADRMADMGFMPDVKHLLSYIVVEHQMLLFSATLDGNVDKFIKQYLHKPFRYEVKSEQQQSKAVHLFWHANQDRVALAAQISEKSSSTIIFCRTKRGVDKLARQLKDEGVKAVAIHGDRSQAQRLRALEQFTDGRVSTMVATDVAARGLHIDNVDCVIHFDQPDDHTDYVHRSGRTARAGAEGTVISLVPKGQIHLARRVQKNLKMQNRITSPDWDAVNHLGSLEIVVKPRKRRPGPRSGSTKQSHHRNHRSSKNRRRGPRRPKSTNKSRTNNA